MEETGEVPGAWAGDSRWAGGLGGFAGFGGGAHCSCLKVEGDSAPIQGGVRSVQLAKLISTDVTWAEDDGWHGKCYGLC